MYIRLQLRSGFSGDNLYIYRIKIPTTDYVYIFIGRIPHLQNCGFKRF